jgi:hypothetical protein
MLAGILQTAQFICGFFCSSFAHAKHTAKWPQGTNEWVFSCPRQTVHTSDISEK